MPRVPHRLRRKLFLISALVFRLFALQASGAPADVTYRTGVSEVRLTFFASDERNRGVDTLESSDIAIVDDGMVIRRFRSFHRSNLTRLQIVVLVDASQSVLSQYQQEIAGVLRVISETPSIANDDVSVISFGGMQSAVVCSGNCASADVVSRLKTTRADGATPLFDALEFAGNFLMQHRDPEARPVLLLFSDGEDTISKVSLNHALEAVLAGEAQVYAVDLNDELRPSDGSAALETMIGATGGRHLFIRQGAADLLSALLEDLHAGYLVTYKLPNQNAGFHWIRILPTRNLKLQFRCRRGYVYHDENR